MLSWNQVQKHSRFYRTLRLGCLSPLSAIHRGWSAFAIVCFYAVIFAVADGTLLAQTSPGIPQGFPSELPSEFEAGGAFGQSRMSPLGSRHQPPGTRESTPDGLKVLYSKYLRLVTDLPVSDAIARLPAEFDEAFEGVAQYFDCDKSRIADWRGTAYLMGDRQRFSQAGYIPAAVPPFQHGYQMGDEMWLMEQQSDYYRRHLLIHEGTHWFMNRHFGAAGPPWYMEGMADYLATHRMENNRLQLAILPSSREEVPYWGRTKLIREELLAGKAPSLESILRYNSTAHQSVSAYAWSWAAVSFLENHPTSQAAFRKIAQVRRLDSSGTISKTLFTRLKDDWSRLRMSWQAYASELDYGYDFSRGLVVIDSQVRPIGNSQVSVQIAADRSWQSAGILVGENQKLEIAASGEFVVARDPRIWTCQAGGVTLKYHEGQPLGILMAAIVPIPTDEPANTNRWPSEPIGLRKTVESARGGLLFFKINESVAGLHDNSGTLTVRITAK